MRNAINEYTHMNMASSHPIGAKNNPDTASIVANTSVNITDQKKIPLGFTDQKWPVLRVTNMVKCPATTNFKNIKDCSTPVSKCRTTLPI